MALRESRSASLAYFYFDFHDEDKRNRCGLLLSILSQLSVQSNLCCGVLSRLYSAHDDGVRKPSDDVLKQCLEDMLLLPAHGPVYLIIDALDECPNNFGMPTSREDVLNLVNGLVNMRLPNLHICVTSRPEFDIQTAFEPLTSLCVSLASNWSKFPSLPASSQRVHQAPRVSSLLCLSELFRLSHFQV